jgi:hypothetical protein
MLKSRAIGPVGTALRVVAGFGLIYLAGAVEGGAWDVSWYDPVVGFVVLPGVMVLLGLLARRHSGAPLHFTGVRGHAANALVIGLLLINPYTAGGAVLFYGVTMLVAGWLGQRGCEATVISNLVLRRDDQVGCPVFLPTDEAEARLISRTKSNRAATETGQG